MANGSSEDEFDEASDQPLLKTHQEEAAADQLASMTLAEPERELEIEATASETADSSQQQQSPEPVLTYPAISEERKVENNEEGPTRSLSAVDQAEMATATDSKKKRQVCVGLAPPAFAWDVPFFLVSTALLAHGMRLALARLMLATTPCTSSRARCLKLLRCTFILFHHRRSTGGGRSLQPDWWTSTAD